ncbi:hypothetical protein D0T12_06355 [Actinomadura spongiicola]|uniref:RHS repeat protein n=1 Tax=Actinomadura spongiicola TaxID=2303421 RepID=A0A372GLH1_9ACTN|nr:hypothetical protein [Actinomadura spongiicola]RFS86234.1 hypothetical protein D0T12_06355 [Actinomadura spongiicola]
MQTLTYDPAGRLKTEKTPGTGHVTKLTRGDQQFVYDWDDNGRLVERGRDGQRADRGGLVDHHQHTVVLGELGEQRLQLRLVVTYDPAGALKRTTRQTAPPPPTPTTEQASSPT